MPEHGPTGKDLDRERALTEKIDKLLEEEGFGNTIIIAEHPDLDHKIIYWNCHFYEGAKMVAEANRAFRDQVTQDLS